MLRTALFGLGLVSVIAAIAWTARLRQGIAGSRLGSLSVVPWLLWAELTAFVALISVEVFGLGAEKATLEAVLVGLGGLFALAAIVFGSRLVDRIGAQVTALEAQVASRVAELTLAKQAAEQRREQLRDTIEAAGVVPFVFDPGGAGFTWTAPDSRSALFQRLKGRTAAELGAAIHPEDRKVVERTFATPGPTATVEFRVGAVHTRWLRMVASRRPDGTLRGVLSDVTERRTLELEVQQLHRLEALGQLAAGVAHEINTPVQFIGDSVSYAQEAFGQLATHLALAERLASGAGGAGPELRASREASDVDFTLTELPAALDRAQEGVRRVTGIVTAMKDFARAGGDTAEPADLNRAVASTTVVARNEYKYVAELVFEPGELPPVPCRLGDINQVVLNLIVNAAHAIAERREAQHTEAPGTIRVRTTAVPGAVRLSVEDDGCGIPLEVQPRVFEPFFTTKPVGKGSGQGLPLSLAIVRRHHGRIWFESRPGAGTTFHVELPVPGEDASAATAPPATSVPSPGPGTAASAASRTW